jgi:hypothetical protein
MLMQLYHHVLQLMGHAALRSGLAIVAAIPHNPRQVHGISRVRYSNDSANNTWAAKYAAYQATTYLQV